MFSLTTKADYGISALLSLAENYNKGLLQIKDISEKKKIPQNYLEQILNRLIKHNLIKAVRGKNGGYSLKENPDKITFLECLEALEGEIKLSEHNNENFQVREIYKELEKEIKKSLTISLTDLLTKQQNIMFHI